MSSHSIRPIVRRWTIVPALLAPVFLLSRCGGPGGSPASAGSGGSAPNAGGAPAGGAQSGNTGFAGSSGSAPLSGSGTGGSAAGGSGTSGSQAGSAGQVSGGTDAMGGSGPGGAAGPAGAAGASTGGAATGGSGGAIGSAGASGAPGGLTGGSGVHRMEKLNRGVVAIKAGSGVYVGWRMLGFEYDATNPTNVAYAVYRDGTKVATVTDSTNYQDAAGTATSSYSVRVVLGGVEGAASETAKVWPNPYLRIPLEIPPGGTTPGADRCGAAGSSERANPNEAYMYTASDASAADLDGDGQYEIILKWDPTNARDNAHEGCTGNQILDAYKFDLATGTSTRLWRIDLGRNIRAGAHYTQFIVYDFDGDGKAEMAVKTAPGTRDGTGAYLKLGPAAGDNDNDDYRGVDNDGARGGYVLTGPEYLTVFDGLSGAERATAAFDQARGTVSAWGDAYGNRVDRFLATAAYLDSSGLPSFVMARGYYTRTTLTAWNFRNGQLTQLWKFDSNTSKSDSAGRPFTGQGAHSLSVANVDADPGQEILYGAMAIDHDGKGKCSTGLGHGDALHVSDFIVSRPGLEVFMPHEDTSKPTYDIRDANTCAIIHQSARTGVDQGRGVAADVSPDSPGAEMWAGTNYLESGTGKDLGGSPKSTNFLTWWDADESRELQDGTTIFKFNGAQALLSAAGCTSNNGTKSTPTIVADLVGDWREEVIWRETNNAALRLYATTAVTARRIYTLMHDPQYRIAISWQNVAYNQPPHPSFHIGAGMAAPPVPNITVR